LAFVEDRQLIELSVSPKRSLFPLLNRAEAMTPLIVLLALVPPLYVLVNRTLTPLDAIWGLKAVRVATSDSAASWLDPSMPGGTESEVPLKWQPPLSSWLVAWTMRSTGTERPLALVLVSLLATAALIMFTFVLTDRLRGPQFAWWTTCLVALHGPILQSAQTPAPVALTLAFAVAACWGFTAHVQDSKRLFSLPLLGAGLAWGLCLLAGGAVALVVLAILLIYVLAIARSSKSLKKANGSKPQKRWKGRPALQSLGILTLIGLALGGWWGIWLTFRHGWPFVRAWFSGSVSLGNPNVTDLGTVEQLLFDASQMGGALVGFTLLGLGSGFQMLRDPKVAKDRPGLVLVLSWMGLAGLVWLGLRVASHQTGGFAVVWRGFFLVPQTMLAALAIEQIGTRRIGYFGVLLGLAITAGLLTLVPVEMGFGLGDGAETLWPSILPTMKGVPTPSASWAIRLLWGSVFLATIGAAASWLVWRMLRNNDFRQRLFLGTSLAVLVMLHGLLGFWGVRQASVDDRALSNLRKEMVQERNVSRYTIISPNHSPLTLRFTFASLWPEVPWSELNSWYDAELTEDVAEGREIEGSHLVIDWNDRDTRAPTLRVPDPEGNAHIVEFTPVGSPQALWNYRLRIYHLTDRPPIRR
jgi:hypothetical protein